jgi:hypothetical protein
MSRSGYTDDWNDFASIAWRGAVASAIRGKRGQAFLYEMLHAMAALPEPKLIDYDLEREGSYCAIGSVGKARGIDMKGVDPENRDHVAALFGVAPALIAEVTYMNDESAWHAETPEARFERMRRWIESELFDRTPTHPSATRGTP